MKREDGYYWIRLFSFGRKWQPAEWESDKNIWWIIGTDQQYSEGEAFEIGERIIACHI